LKNGKKILRDLESLQKGISNFKYPDLVSEKGNLIVFTECKSSYINCNKYFKQKKSLNALKNKGYKVEVLSLELNV